jgi:hypothetical protein
MYMTAEGERVVSMRDFSPALAAIGNRTERANATDRTDERRRRMMEISG